MKIKITESIFHGVDTVISAQKGTQLDMSGCKFTDCRKIVDVKDPPGLLQYLGLSNETPLPLLRQMLEVVAAGNSDRSDLEARSRSVGILNWLEAGANVSTLLSGLIAIGQSGVVQALLDLLAK